jgi:hypothetical protein
MGADSMRAARCPTCGRIVLALCDAAGSAIELVAFDAIPRCHCRRGPRRSLRSAALELVERLASDSQAAATTLSSGFSADFDGPSPSQPPKKGARRSR